MATLRPAARPLAAWKTALRQARCSKLQQRCFADLSNTQPKALHANGLIKQSGKVHNPIKVYPPPATAANKCKDPIAAVTATQLSTLDPTGARAHLFSKTNRDAAKVGDILLVRQRNGDPFAGVCLNIRRRGVDTAILLRNQLTRVGVEMWYKVFSPNVEAIEVVQRREKRARRARLYYMRKPKHDRGSVENIVRQYQRQKAMLRGGGSTRGRGANAGKKAGKKGK
ncbi:54S ribosomal protein IMG1 [Lasiodiplodia hormozganensis]|uniref:54S ribosomal protein IMG1 n=1 Tax=Lasiodiplodia hormozganensis TaxID=869390 RepID=A0AA39XPF4_9PEZI|nr:54S ribosomal protein IMG1 [Lasiodiplodia hormozganensis]